MDRYQRNLLCNNFGTDQQKMLLDAKVVVIGAGGLGSYLLQEIVAAGVGTVGIVEFDNVSISNLNRQTLYTTADIGKSKAESAKERLNAINPDTKIILHQTRFNRDNSHSIISKYDMVVDCCDNYQTRYDMDIACEELSIPLIHSSVTHLNGTATTFRYGGSPTYRDLYGEQNDSHGAVPGVLSPIVGLMGSIEAAEVIKIATKTGEPLFEKVLTIDVSNNSYNIYSIR